MSDFDFLIPLSLDALREAQSTRQYAVKDVYSASEIPKKIQECQVVFRQDGAKFITNSRYFDVLYSVLVHFDAVEEEFRNRAWELLIKAMAKVTADLALLLDEEGLRSKEKLEWLNILKMTTYLACTIMECFEKYHLKPSTDTLDLGKKKKAPKKSDYGIDWEEERNRMLLQLYSILHHPLQRLWDPPVVEEDYVNLIANCCYKMLETPSMNLVRSKPSRDSIFQVLGLLVKKFNHGLACSLKLMQLLQHFEHLVNPVACGVISIMEDFGNTSVLSELIREIAKIDHQSMAKDSSGMRNYSQFLVEVAEKSPQVIMPSLSLIINFLDEEFYGLRNCVLSILGSIVLKVLKGEQLDQKSKDLRDQCLDHLEEHLHDVHAFVRSKVLHVWQDLVVEKAVPLARQRNVMQLVLGRLKDKSSNVRKQAIQLLTAFLKGNPFAAKLPLEELEQQLTEEKARLHELAPELAKEEEEEGKENQPRTPRDCWLTILPLVIRDVCDIINEEGEDMDEEDSLPSDVTLNSAVSDVAEALMTNKFVRATKLLRSSFEVFNGAPVFQTTEDQMDPKIYEDETDEQLNEEQIKYMVILERIFLSAKVMEQKKQGAEVEEKEGEEEGKDDKPEGEVDPEEKKEKEEITKQKMLVNYLKEGLGFSQVIHNALPLVCQMMASKQVSDVLEAVQFFVTAFEFGLLNAMSGVRRMLSLVWSKEQAIKDAVVEAYQRLYINEDAPNARVRAQNIVRNLSALITGATLGERTSMEEIVAQFVNTGDINKHCVTLLWERFTKAIPDTSDDDSRSALVLLAMCANSEESIVKSNIPVLVMCGLGERGEKDYLLVKEACQALLKMATHKPKTESSDPPYRLNSDHDIFVRLCDILVKGISNLEDRQYSPMAIEAISTIYSLAEQPDVICGELLKRLCTAMQEIQKAEPEVQENKEGEDAESTEGSEPPPLPNTPGLQNVPMGVLSRFFVVVGHMAIRQLIHLDSHVFSELKRRNHLKELHQEEKMKNKKSKQKAKKRKSLATSALEVQKELSGSQQSTTGGEDIDEEMGLTGAVADDMEAEYIRNICDTEIITGDNLLSFIRPLIWSVCSNPSKYPDPGLLTAATLALSKFMMVSAEVCEDNLQLLFTILEKSEEPVIRANVIIALGDLSFRFPNQTEPWTPKIYARLHDHCPMVRRNTLTILTHLILNDMIKVKGQISDIALCITDDDNRILGLSKLFFSELARKGNALYNVLPDIISRLSDPELKIEESRYRHIIGHIFGLINKDNKMEMLVEKLCHRYQATTSHRQWRDITYCLSLLQFNDKCIGKLSGSFACYSDKLHEREVYDFFLGIMANARKLAKDQAKTAIEELEGRMQECHSKGVEDENAINAAQRTKNKYNKKSRRQSSVNPTLNAGAGGRSGRKAANRSSHKAESSDEEDGEYEPEEEDNNAQLHPVHRGNKENTSPSTRRSSDRSQSKKKLIESSDEEDEGVGTQEANMSRTSSGGAGSSDDFKSTTANQSVRKNVRIAKPKPLTESKTVRSSRRK